MGDQVKARARQAQLQATQTQDGYDEGIEGWEPQRPRTSQRPMQTRAPRRTSSDDIIADYDEQEYAPRSRRASRPAQPTAKTQTQRTNGGTMRITTGPQIPAARSARRSTTTQVQPIQERRQLRPRTYIPQGEPESDQSLNRHLRRHGIQIHWSVFAGGGMLFLLMLWFVLSLIVMLWTNDVYNPAHYGPSHGDVARANIAGKALYVQGVNTDGQTYVIIIPTDHPSQSRILIGPQAKDRLVDIQVKDVNSDGKVDIVENLVAPVQLMRLEPDVQSYTFYGDGKGNFKSQTGGE